MSLTQSQRLQLIENLWQWRRDRLVADGVKLPGHDAAAAVSGSVRRDLLLFGFAVVEVVWEQREKTADDLRWELFPRPGKVWSPRVRLRRAPPAST